MIEKLACKLGRNDEEPNIELAEYLCQNMDTAGIEEIVRGLTDCDKAVASDCIKVLYEVGDRNPELISGYANEFITCLGSKNNRLVWGGMTALAKIAVQSAQLIYERIDIVLSAYEKGSTITVDNSISVFAGLCRANDDYAKTILPVLLKHLQKCRPKEVAQHAGRASLCFCGQNADDFIEVLEKRKPHLAAAQQARVNKLLKTLYGMRR